MVALSVVLCVCLFVLHVAWSTFNNAYQLYSLFGGKWEEVVLILLFIYFVVIVIILYNDQQTHNYLTIISLLHVSTL